MKCLRLALQVAYATQLRPMAFQIQARFKYTQHQGVKGIRNRKSYYEAQIQVGQQTESEHQVTHTTDSVDMRFLDDR